MSTPEQPATSPVELEAKSRDAARMPAIFLGSAVATILVGAILFVAVNPIVGAAVAAFGLFDLAMIPAFRSYRSSTARKADLAQAEAGTRAEEAGEPGEMPAGDPSYNPYARED